MTGKVREERMAEEEEKHRPELMRKGRRVGTLAFYAMRDIPCNGRKRPSGIRIWSCPSPVYLDERGIDIFEAAAFL